MPKTSLPPCPEGKFRNPITHRCKKIKKIPMTATASVYYMRKVRGQNCYSVRNRKTKRIFSKCTTKENAEKQLKILRAKLYNK
jgi:hypothetical protein